jgi:hypothetical protein
MLLDIYDAWIKEKKAHFQVPILPVVAIVLVLGMSGWT